MIADYNIYILNIKERIIFYGLGFFAIAFIIWLFFDSIPLCIAGMPMAFLGEKYICEFLAKKRKDKLYAEFADFLYSVSASVAVGKDMREALAEAHENLKHIAQSDSLMVAELSEMLRKIEESNQSEKVLLLDFASRSGISDIKSFVEVYYICRDTGGNLLRAVNKSVQIITDKLIIEKDIKVFISQKRFEGRLITALPPAIILFLRVLSPEYLKPLYESGGGRLLMLGSVVCVCFAYRFSEKLADVVFEQTTEGGIPELLGQMSLLLNAGMVLQTVFEKLASEGQNAGNKLSIVFADLYEKSVKTNIPMVNLIREYAIANNSRALMRLANIMSDNLSKGTMLVDKLDSEAEMLWHMSKKDVEEKGKLAETKMSFPMGLMLVVVIAITTAPALMTL